jgi:hypothetical protein
MRRLLTRRVSRGWWRCLEAATAVQPQSTRLKKHAHPLGMRRRRRGRSMSFPPLSGRWHGVSSATLYHGTRWYLPSVSLTSCVCTPTTIFASLPLGPTFSPLQQLQKRLEGQRKERVILLPCRRPHTPSPVHHCEHLHCTVIRGPGPHWCGHGLVSPPHQAFLLLGRVHVLFPTAPVTLLPLPLLLLQQLLLGVALGTRDKGGGDKGSSWYLGVGLTTTRPWL